MTDALSRLAIRVWTVGMTWLLLAVLCLVPVAPALAAGPAAAAGSGATSGRIAGEAASAQAARQDGDEGRGEGPSNPYDMKALRQFDAGSHRAEEPT
jgi:hypothetical protein